MGGKQKTVKDLFVLLKPTILLLVVIFRYPIGWEVIQACQSD